MLAPPEAARGRLGPSVLDERVMFCDEPLSPSVQTDALRGPGTYDYFTGAYASPKTLRRCSGALDELTKNG